MDRFDYDCLDYLCPSWVLWIKENGRELATHPHHLDLRKDSNQSHTRETAEGKRPGDATHTQHLPQTGQSPEAMSGALGVKIPSPTPRNLPPTSRLLTGSGQGTEDWESGKEHALTRQLQNAHEYTMRLGPIAPSYRRQRLRGFNLLPRSPRGPG